MILSQFSQLAKSASHFAAIRTGEIVELYDDPIPIALSHQDAERLSYVLGCQVLSATNSFVTDSLTCCCWKRAGISGMLPLVTTTRNLCIATA